MTTECLIEDFDEDNVTSCTSGKVYDHQYLGKTIVSDFNLACDGQEWKIPLVESMSFVGIMIAAMTFGVLADKYGRRHILMTCLTITVLAGICESLATLSYLPGHIVPAVKQFLSILIARHHVF